MLAHMWVNIAGTNGNETSRNARDILEPDMTPAEIRRATDLARDVHGLGLPELRAVKATWDHSPGFRLCPCGLLPGSAVQGAIGVSIGRELVDLASILFEDRHPQHVVVGPFCSR